MEHSNTAYFLKGNIPIAKVCGIAFFVLLSTGAAAQTRGTVTVIKDPRIDTLIARRLALNKLPNSNTGSNAVFNGNGYRVQFFTGSNRTEAYNAQSKFNDLYPALKTYIIYSEPNFKVKAGDFRTRLEAAHLMEQLRAQFPSLFIISEKINLPKQDNPNDQR